MIHRHIQETETLMKDMLREEYYTLDPTMVVLSTDYQTAGRGQHDHKWESARGKNLILGFIVHPTAYSARDQKQISDIVAEVVGKTMDYWLAEKGLCTWMKQPNDIYVGKQKLAGLLIEHDVAGGRILTTRIGLGININQEVFLSDAPNPCSLHTLLGHPVSREEVLARLIKYMEEAFA